MITLSKRRIHYFYIFTSIFQLLYLLLFPLIRGFVSIFNPNAWIQTFSMQIVILSAICIISILRWYMYEFSIDEKSVKIRSGIFFKVYNDIPIERIASVEIIVSPVDYIFRSAKIKIDTIGGINNKPDISFHVWHNDAEIIKNINNIEVIYKSKNKKNTPDFRTNFINVLATAFTSSNVGVGLLIGYIFFNYASKILSKELTDKIIGTINGYINKVIFGIPPVITVIAYILLAGWLLSFLTLLLRYMFFSVYRKQGILNIRYGFFIHYNSSISIKNINTIRIRQTLFMKMLGVCSVFAHCAGYGRSRGEIPILIPAENKKKLSRKLDALLPEFTQDIIYKIKPRPDSIWRFGWGPGMWIVIISAVALFFHRFISNHLNIRTKTIIIIAAAALTPFIWWFIVRIIEKFHTSVEISRNSVVIQSANFLGFERIIIPKSHLQSITLLQDPFQQFQNMCDIYIKSKSNIGDTFRAKNLSYDEALIFKQQLMAFMNS